jgi:outer membrane protein assembly factor BamB
MKKWIWAGALPAMALVCVACSDSDDGSGTQDGTVDPDGTQPGTMLPGTSVPQPTGSAGAGASDPGTGTGTGTDPGTGGTDPGSGGTDPGTGGTDPGSGTGTGTDPGSGGTDPGGPVWSHMGFDERNWYFNPNETTLSVENASSLVEKWRFTVAGYPPGTPVVGGGKVFVHATGGVYALDFGTGAELWHRDDLPGTASVAWEPGFIYVHDAQAGLWKLNAADGTTVWGPVVTYTLDGCDGTSSPVLAGDKVVVGHSCGALEVSLSAGGAQGGVEAHLKADGGKAWSYTTVEGGEDGAMVWSTVGVDLATSTVYASTGNNYTTAGANSDAIHALDLETGMRKWKSQVRSGDVWSLAAFTNLDTDFGANPIVADVGGQTVVAAGDKGSAFWGLDAASGTTLWSREQLSPSRDQAHGGILMNGAFDGQYYYAVSNDSAGGASVLHAMDPADGLADIWPARTFSGKFAWGAPSLANGLLVVPIDAELHVLNAATGEELTMFDTGGTIAAGAAAIVGGQIIVQSGLSYQLDNSVKNNNQIIAYGLP